MCLTYAVRSAPGDYGKIDPNAAPNECYYVQFDRMSFFIFDLLVLLSFELGDHSAIRAAIRQLILIVVVVVLTVTSAFRYRTPTAPIGHLRHAISILVSPGTSLRRVMYRDGKPRTNTSPPPKSNETYVRCRVLSRVIR